MRGACNTLGWSLGTREKGTRSVQGLRKAAAPFPEHSLWVVEEDWQMWQGWVVGLMQRVVELGGILSFHCSALSRTFLSSLVSQEAVTLLRNCRQLMKAVLDDQRLVTLQLEGGALLARLRKEESCVVLTEDYR